MNRRSQLLIFAIVAASTPAVLGAEALLRRYLMPPEIEEIRAWLHPRVAPIGWSLVAVALATVVLAFALHRRLFASALARQPASLPEAERVGRSQLETMLIATSIAQLPALLASLAYTFGADASATHLTIGVGTLGVLVQWPALRRLGL